MARERNPNNGRLYVVCIGHRDAPNSSASAWGVLLLDELKPTNSKLYSLVPETQDEYDDAQMALGAPISVNFFELVNNTSPLAVLDDLITPGILSESGDISVDRSTDSTQPGAVCVCLAYFYLGASPRIAPDYNEDSEMSFRVCLTKALHHTRRMYRPSDDKEVHTRRSKQMSANWSLEATQNWAILAYRQVHRLFQLADFNEMNREDMMVELDVRIEEGRAEREERDWLQFVRRVFDIASSTI
ncbi:hypothetical protein EST38_g8997 [Candolleomyces aberdarensis]|uniref:Uncharacterized protein n=1 Tax=Candolleomyces aberdarensis TaxID=2316362 RepID=A0A4Q2DB35_9AGAR|nr:hypothetical protein EST38_g8997 [Candolleomyces aberdarensis]